MKKVITASLLTLAAVVFLTGTLHDTANAESTLDRVLKRKEIKVGTLLATPPFGMRDADNNPCGFDVDMAKELAKALGVKLTLLDVATAANRIPYLTTGKVDILIGTLQRTLARAQVVGFTDPYVRTGLVIVTRKETTDIHHYKDLVGKKVAVARGGFCDITLSKVAPEAIPLRFPSTVEVWLALEQGKADAVIETNVIAYWEEKIHPEVKVVCEPFTHHYWGFGAKRDDQEWINWLNLFICELRLSGKLEEIWKKWFGRSMVPLTPVEWK